MSFTNQVVLVTGAASGIGAATARLFAEKGARVVLADVQKEKLEEQVLALKAEKFDASPLWMDVSSYEHVQGGIQYVVQQKGSLDIIINNAGVGNKAMVKTAEHTLEDWDRVIAINQTGVFFCMKFALQQMLKQGHGNIVNVASLAGLKASGRNLAYSASKFAVVGMTKSAALEYASKNIRINCVCPSYTHSALLDQVFEADPSMHDKLLKYVPMKRYGEPNEIAEAILWLASNKTEFITGQAITIDGGLSL